MATKKDTTKKEAEVAVVSSVILNPRITEKAALASGKGTYLFDIAPTATKSEVAKAFEAQYKQKAVRVNIVKIPRKTYFRRGKLGFGSVTKKAYVRVAKGVTINIA